MEKRGDINTQTPGAKPCCGGQCNTKSATVSLQPVRVPQDFLDKAAEKRPASTTTSQP